MARPRRDPISAPRGAGRGLALIAALLVAGLLAVHFLAPEPDVQTAQAPTTLAR